MPQLLSFFRFIIFRNVFIGFCAFFLFQTSRLINHLPFALTPAAIFVFSATIIYYNFHEMSATLDFTSFASIKGSLGNLSFPIAEKIILIVFSLVAIGSVAFLPLKVLLILSILLVLSFLYSIPVIPWRGKRIRIREILFFKLGIISFCWAVMAVSVSLYEAEILLDTFIFNIEFLSVALFVFALCLPFEIRDIELEKSRGLRTIPIEYGIRIAKLSGFFALLFCILLQWLLFSRDYISPGTFIVLTFSYIITMLFVLFSSDKPSDLYCKFYVDGLMIFQFLLVFLSLKLS